MMLAVARRGLAAAINDAENGIGHLSCDDPKIMEQVRAHWRRLYDTYMNGSKRLKPSDYCKRELGMKQVKSRAWLERYWAASGFREPASCGAPADCQHGAHLVEDASLVLLRCLHVLIPESQGDLSLRRHADPVFHKTSQTGPVPFALIPDEAPLCTTRSKNVRHVAHAVKSRVRTIMLDRRVYRVAMQAKGGR